MDSKRYLEFFNGEFDSTIENKTNIAEKPYVGYSKTSDKVVFTALADIPEYITLEAQSSSTIQLTKLSTNQLLEWSKDTITWESMDMGTHLSLEESECIYIRGILLADNTSNNYTQFSITGSVKVTGDYNTLWKWYDPNTNLKMYCGYKLFAECKGLVEVSSINTIYGANTCYENMFEKCTGITSIQINDDTMIISANQYRDCKNLSTVYYNNQAYTNGTDLITDLLTNEVDVGDDAFYGTALCPSSPANSSSSNFGSSSFNSYFNSL